MLNLTVAITVAGALLFAAACSPQAAQDDQPETFPLELSVQEIMTGVITPATNVIWGRSFADDLSEEDWHRFLESAIQLSLAASAIALAPPEESANGGAASGNAVAWREWSDQLAELALNAKAAAESQDQAALVDAGDAMVEACEACHTVFLTGAQ